MLHQPIMWFILHKEQDDLDYRRRTEVTYSKPVMEGRGGELERALSEKPVFAHPSYHTHFVKAVTPAARSCKPTCQPL